MGKYIDEDDDMGAQSKLDRIIEYVVKAVIVAILGFLWQIDRNQNELLRRFEQTDMRISQLEREMVSVKSAMVSWDALKRTELKLDYLLEKAGYKLPNYLKEKNV